MSWQLSIYYIWQNPIEPGNESILKYMADVLAFKINDTNAVKIDLKWRWISVERGGSHW